MQLKLQCAEAVYKQKIVAASKNFISGDDLYPRIKSRGMFPVGDAPNSNTVYNRTVPLRKIYKQLGSEEPICIPHQVRHDENYLEIYQNLWVGWAWVGWNTPFPPWDNQIELLY